MILRPIIVGGVVALAFSGCADPYAHDHPQPSQRRAAVVRPRPVAAAPADDTARTFATRWINWDWRSAPAQQRALARLATGTLAKQLRANAASARIDASLARDRPGSRGAVVTIDVTARGKQAAGIVVTRELGYTDVHPDLGGEHYRVARIRLVHISRTWEVTTWAPQP